MSGFEIGKQISWAGGEGEIIKIDARDGDQADLLHVLDDGEITKIPSTLPIECIEGIPEQLEAAEFDDATRFDLRTLATRLDLAHREDRFVALTSSRIEIVPYQVQAAYEILNSYDQRYLIGDEVGLGKTIEAGIVIEELIARGRGDRVLIMVPAPLTNQWQTELREKFGQDFVIYDRGYVDAKRQAHPNQNVWSHEDRIITSIDFAKQDDLRAALANLDEEWDIAVVDEAHHLTARRQGDTVEKVDRYRAGEVVAENSDALLFLTGTPHKGKPDQFYFMIRLLDPYRFRDEHDITPEELDDLMIRRLKRDMYEGDGSRMFPEKDIQTIPVEFTPEERELYEDVTEYISEYYNLADREDNSAAGFAMVLYQKRLVSSIHAIKRSLRKRIESIERGGVDSGELSEVVEALLPRYRTDPESLTEAQREKVESELEGVAVSRDPEAIQEELEIVRELHEQARQITTDSKAEALREHVEGVLADDPDEKVLVFTEYTDTLEYLREQVFADHDVAQIYGDLDNRQRREEVEKFRNEANIMLATDAAREGLNLQFAHIMVNYDLPWNPIRIDQRIGRLHRYGQEATVEIRNLFIRDTRESVILETLFEKLEEIEETLGMSSDVLGIVLDDVDIESEIMEAATGGQSADEVAADVDALIDERKDALATIEEEFLVRDNFDLRNEDQEIVEVIERSPEDTVGEDDIERLVRDFCAEFGGGVHHSRSVPGVDEVYRIDVPDVITGDNVADSYEPATFDREVAVDNEEITFVAVDHPLVRAIASFAQDTDYTGGRTAVKIAEEGEPVPGALFTFRLAYLSEGEPVTERIEQVYVDMDGNATTDPPALAGGLPAVEAPRRTGVAEVASRATELHTIAERKARDVIEDLAGEARREREREIDIRKEHAERYFENQLEKLEERLERYRERDRQEDTDMSALINKTARQIEDLKQEREEELEQLEAERQLVADEPELISAAVVIEGFDS